MDEAADSAPGAAEIAGDLRRPRIVGAGGPAAVVDSERLAGLETRPRLASPGGREMENHAMGYRHYDSGPVSFEQVPARLRPGAVVRFAPGSGRVHRAPRSLSP
jgi:hypothetical protein